MIALPMHPSYAYPIRELKADPYAILKAAQDRANEQLSGKVEMDLVSKIGPDGQIHVDQGIVAGCSGGTYESLCAVADILRGKSCGNGPFKFSAYPDSMPTYLELVKNGAVADIVSAGGIFRESFCGPCFGAGDTPANGEFSIRHTTRNFPNREGSKPGEGQISGVALMDARSIAATAANGGVLTAASEVVHEPLAAPPYHFDKERVRQACLQRLGPGRAGPRAAFWPQHQGLARAAGPERRPAAAHHEPHHRPGHDDRRADPLGRDFLLPLQPAAPGGVHALPQGPGLCRPRQGRAGAGRRAQSGQAARRGRRRLCGAAGRRLHGGPADTNIGSAIFANKPGDGSAREQAASCQRVLGGAANFALEYATKRYRSNCINWGMLPFLTTEPDALPLGGYVFVPGVRKALLEKAETIPAFCALPGEHGWQVRAITLRLGALTDAERQILADGCLINYYKNN